ncbi:MAG: hypothetical protein ACRBB4_11260 [Neptuniibacter sp.]
MTSNVSGLVKRATQLAAECEKKKDFKQAIELYIKAINLEPTNTLAVTSLCAIYFNMGKHDVVEKILLGVIKIAPNNCYFYFQLGKLYTTQRQFDKAIDQFLKSFKLNKDLKENYLNLAHAYAEKHEYVTALEYAQEGIKKYPDYAKLYNNIAYILRALGDIEGAFRYQEISVDKNPREFSLFSNYLFYLSQSPFVSPEEYLEKAKEYGCRVSQGIKQYETWPGLASKEKLRIGFVSGDLRNHPVSFFIENWLGLIDKTKFELVAYYNFSQNDEKTLSLHSMFSEWYPVTALSDAELAEKIHKDHIHILIDLSGHTAHNRLPAFAWKPAPIQISWVGFPTSTGLEQMDYMMPNRNMSPPEFDHHYLEKQWYLPSAGCLKPPEVDIDVNDLPAIKNRYITFGSFHSVTKLTDQVLTTWSEILKRLPDSKILFKCKELKELKTQEVLLEKMVNLGIEPDRILIEGPCPLQEYFKAYHSIDIGLDPFPYNSGTVGYHSVWMGVPYVALAGDRLLSRVGYSNIQLVGLEQFAAESIEEYIQIAVDVASDLENLQSIRQKLRQTSLDSGLYDGSKMALDLETAFESMWQQFLNNNDNTDK